MGWFWDGSGGYLLPQGRGAIGFPWVGEKPWGSKWGGFGMDRGAICFRRGGGPLASHGWGKSPGEANGVVLGWIGGLFASAGAGGHWLPMGGGKALGKQMGWFWDGSGGYLLPPGRGAI